MRTVVMLIGMTLAIAILAFSGLYVVSEVKLRDVQHGPAFDYPIPSGTGSIERGRHIARTRGCLGCHGQELQGKDFSEQWDWPERAAAPNLSAYAKENDTATIEAAIRQGIGRDGKALVSMPSYNFTRMTDQDIAALIAFMQAAPVFKNPLPKPKLGWSVRWDFASGAETHMADWVATVPKLRVDPAAVQLAQGEYLAMTMCNECHGLDVRGQTQYEPATPDLAIVAAYTRAAFETLIESGIALGGRKLGLMTLVAADRFKELADEEVDALYAFLISLPAEPAPENVPWRPTL